jgi:hypothetical protein
MHAVVTTDPGGAGGAKLVDAGEWRGVGRCIDAVRRDR